jgi:predicted MFS family arabinose efflux permease
MVARLSPAHRRGEASGYFQTGLMIASGMLPAAALWFLDLTNFTAVFLVASVSALAGSGLSLAIRLQKRAAPVRQAESLLASLVERGALLPSALLLLLNLSFPAAAAFVPLYAREIGVENVALFFLIQGTANVVTQATLGRLSDRIGRSLTIAIGFFIAGTGLVLLSQASNFANLTAGGAIYAFGSSVANPALMAMVMDRAQPAKIGAAMATYSLSFQIGSAGGALAGGYLIRWSGFESMYLVVILPLLIGIGITWLLRGARPVHAAV